MHTTIRNTGEKINADFFADGHRAAMDAVQRTGNGGDAK
jgi:hypothetical protein